ncbi:unnamed protein product [Ilex paraguariensis]|uniref:Uncharacterized protein n=1 Tax=Ilex paraguariensis TaxID=185542 RepID=A0ABC8S167_9AQUA
METSTEKLGYALYLAFCRVLGCDLAIGLKHMSRDEAIMQMFQCFPNDLPEQGENNPMVSGDTDSELDSEYVEEANQTDLESTEYKNFVDDMECSMMIMWIWKFNGPVLNKQEGCKGSIGHSNVNEELNPKDINSDYGSPSELDNVQSVHRIPENSEGNNVQAVQGVSQTNGEGNIIQDARRRGQPNRVRVVVRRRQPNGQEGRDRGRGIGLGKGRGNGLEIGKGGTSITERGVGLSKGRGIGLSS